jgi:hypothetical protein
MPCDAHQELLTGYLESTLAPEEIQSVLGHLDRCGVCRAEVEQNLALRERLVASAGASVQPALEDRVMAGIRSGRAASRVAGGLDSWIAPLLSGVRARRLGLGTAGLVVLLVAVAAVLLREPTLAWTIEQSIEAVRPFGALHLRGTFGGNAECELWARNPADRPRSQRLLIRIGHRAPTIVWTEGNATNYYDPASRTVYTDDALTAGFNPWPGPRLLELARAAGVRMVDTRWRFPWRRTVVTEFSMLSARGPTSARAEFDVETKLLVSLRQWDNMEYRGEPGFEADDITYLPDLPDDAFHVDLPAGVQFRPKPVEVAESMLGVLALPDAGIPTPDLPLDEAGRRVVAEMWQLVLERDVAGFKRLCPMTRGLSDSFLGVFLGGTKDPDAIVEVVDVAPGVLRGHSRLGPVSVVASRVRHGDGGLYEEKTIVQHLLVGSTPRAVIFSQYGQAYRLE